jgi:triphosphoribosyl-dephospho-CoA synthase
MNRTLSIGLCAQLACIWEATARKPGNVHRFHDFSDSTYLDFIVSAAAIAPVLEQASRRRVGEIVLEGVQATRRVTATNTNLGILLLLAPLAAVPPEEDLPTGVVRVLERLDRDDARAVYQAIRLAVPGGLGRVSEQDVNEEPTQTLRQVMTLAADRDLVARQYANGFHEVLAEGVPALCHGLDRMRSVEEAIVFCQLRLLVSQPDSLIARKRGRVEAEEASRLAQDVLNAGWPDAERGRTALTELDAWLRIDGHARNPGTTADLVTACLFAALRADMLTVPTQLPWSAGWQHG